MDAKEVGREFLAKVCESLITLPYDLKALQEAVSDPELERDARELAAGVVIHALSPHEGTAPERFIEDVLLVRLALEQVLAKGGDGAEAFRARFADVYEPLSADLVLFRSQLPGELLQWLAARLASCSRLSHKGKRALQYVDDDEALDLLYEAGLDFQTAYNLTETQVQNRLRRPEQITEFLQRRQAEDLKRRP